MGDDLKLNIGAGKTSLDGFEPVDVANGDRAYPLERPDNSVTEIYASHTLEHFSHTIVLQVLKDWVRVLKPGGRLRIAVPDLRWVATKYLANEPVNIQGYIMGGHTDDNDHHGALFDRESLAEMMLLAGLEQIHQWTSEIADCAALPVSLNLAGYKPISDITRCTDTIAALSAPRFAPTLHMRVSADAFYRVGVRYIVAQGVYWHQVLCECLESLLADAANFRYIITTDYDTIFTGMDVLTLYRLMEIFPEADSICGMQSKRQDKQAMLCNLRGNDGKARTEIPTLELVAKQLTPILTGHFGLTIFRADTLRNHPRPWMVAEPNAENRWGEHRRDADMDFWRRWHEAGRKAYMATHVVAGHMEEVIAWPGTGLKPIYQLVQDFAKQGKPPEVWPTCLRQDDPNSDCSGNGEGDNAETS